MALFEQAFKKIGEAVSDLSSLEVITYTGSVTIKANTKVDTFDKVFAAAKANQNVDLKVLASTRVNIDGDIVAFYDSEIAEEEKLAHNQLVVEATDNRRDTVDMVRDILGDAVKNI